MTKTKVTKVKGKIVKTLRITTKKKQTNKQKNQDRFLQKYFESTGNISQACKHIGITRQAYYLWMTEEDFKTRFDNVLEEFDDMIETKIREIAKGGDKDLLKFWASRKMKKRGFTEKQEIEYSGQSSIKGTIEIIMPNEQKKPKDNIQ